MKMVFHCRLPQSVALTIDLDAKSWLQVQISGTFETAEDEINVATAQEITNILPNAVSRTRTT